MKILTILSLFMLLILVPSVSADSVVNVKYDRWNQNLMTDDVKVTQVQNVYSYTENYYITDSYGNLKFYSSVRVTPTTNTFTIHRPNPRYGTAYHTVVTNVVLNDKVTSVTWTTDLRKYWN